MPRFRSRRSPEEQAAAAVGRLVNLGALRRNPNRPASVRTVENYRHCLARVARDLAREGRELRDLTPETAIEYLRTRTDFGQKHLDMHRQAIQAMLVHVNRRLPKGARLPVVRSSRPTVLKGRACTPAQYRRIAAAQTEPHALATAIAHAAGLRAHELLTLAPPDEQPPDRRPARASKFAGRPGATTRSSARAASSGSSAFPTHSPTDWKTAAVGSPHASPTAAYTTSPATTSAPVAAGARASRPPRSAPWGGAPARTAAAMRTPRSACGSSSANSLGAMRLRPSARSWDTSCPRRPRRTCVDTPDRGAGRGAPPSHRAADGGQRHVADRPGSTARGVPKVRGVGCACPLPTPLLGHHSVRVPPRPLVDGLVDEDRQSDGGHDAHPEDDRILADLVVFRVGCRNTPWGLHAAGCQRPDSPRRPPQPLASRPPDLVVSGRSVRSGCPDCSWLC